jgi:hypothetical protein
MGGRRDVASNGDTGDDDDDDEEEEEEEEDNSVPLSRLERTMSIRLGGDNTGFEDA